MKVLEELIRRIYKESAKELTKWLIEEYILNNPITVTTQNWEIRILVQRDGNGFRADVKVVPRED